MNDEDEDNYRACRIGLIYSNNSGAISDEREESARLWLAEQVELAAMYRGLCD